MPQLPLVPPTGHLLLILLLAQIGLVICTCSKGGDGRSYSPALAQLSLLPDKTNVYLSLPSLFAAGLANSQQVNPILSS
jgi:hypothetical protein